MDGGNVSVAICGRLPAFIARSMLAWMRRPSAKWLWLIPPFLFGMAHLDQVEGFAGGTDARRAPVGLAPNPQTTAEAVVQVYAARTVRWRGYFGVHTWVSVKARHAGCPPMSTFALPGPGPSGVPWLVRSPSLAAGGIAGS